MTKKRILLAEDEPLLRKLFVTILNHSGFEVDAFSDGAQAFSQFLKTEAVKHHYHGLVSDIQMPGLNGLELYHRIRNEEHNRRPYHVTPVVLMSGNYRLFEKELDTILNSDSKSRFIQKPAPEATDVSNALISMGL
jgi:CheY-like chemotaxis protein